MSTEKPTTPDLDDRDPQQIADDNISQYVTGEPEILQEAREQDRFDTANLTRPDTPRENPSTPRQ